MAKPTYNVIFALLDKSKGNNGFIKYRNCDSLQKVKRHVETYFGQWLFVNVYNHKTKEKIACLSPTKIHLFEPLKPYH